MGRPALRVPPRRTTTSNADPIPSLETIDPTTRGSTCPTMHHILCIHLLSGQCAHDAMRHESGALSGRQ